MVSHRIHTAQSLSHRCRPVFLCVYVELSPATLLRLIASLTTPCHTYHIRAGLASILPALHKQTYRHSHSVLSRSQAMCELTNYASQAKLP